MELSKLILKAGYTPKTLAEAIGVTKFAIYAYMSGRAYPSAKKPYGFMQSVRLLRKNHFSGN